MPIMVSGPRCGIAIGTRCSTYIPYMYCVRTSIMVRKPPYMHLGCPRYQFMRARGALNPAAGRGDVPFCLLNFREFRAFHTFSHCYLDRGLCPSSTIRFRVGF